MKCRNFRGPFRRRPAGKFNSCRIIRPGLDFEKQGLIIQGHPRVPDIRRKLQAGDVRCRAGGNSLEHATRIVEGHHSEQTAQNNRQFFFPVMAVRTEIGIPACGDEQPLNRIGQLLMNVVIAAQALIGAGLRRQIIQVREELYSASRA